MSAPKVFISYSWDSDEHKKWVLNLANQLVKNGVDVLLDQYENRLGHNLSYFMERVVRDAEKVLLICTENYKKKAENREGGVGYEYSMINHQWYKSQTNNVKFIPVQRGKESLPIFVDAHISLDMSDDALFDKSLRTLLFNIYDEPEVKKPELGPSPVFDKESFAVNEPKSPPSSVDVFIINQRAREWENFNQELAKLETDDLEKMGKLARSIRESRIMHVKQKIARLCEHKGVIVNIIPELNLPPIDTCIQVLKDLIAQHKLNNVLKMLLGIAAQKRDVELETQVILKSSKYQYLIEKQAENRFTLEEEMEYLNKLLKNLMAIVNNLDNELKEGKTCSI